VLLIQPPHYDSGYARLADECKPLLGYRLDIAFGWIGRDNGVPLSLH
jgi:hypothetical protein